MEERAPPRCLCSVTATITLRELNGRLHVTEQRQAETAPSAASGLESHVSGCFQSYITSLCQQPSLGHPDAFYGH